MDTKSAFGYVILGAVVSSVVTAGGIFMLAKDPVRLQMPELKSHMRSISLVQPGNNPVNSGSKSDRDLKSEYERICERRWKSNYRMRSFCISRMQARR